MAARPQAACPIPPPQHALLAGWICAGHHLYTHEWQPCHIGEWLVQCGRSAGVSSGRRATLTKGLRLLLPGLSHQSRDCYLWSQHLLFQFTLCPIARVIFVKCKSCVIYLFKVLYRQCFLAWHEALLEIPPGFSPWASFFTPAKKRGCSTQW